jgi:hypothetical protein
MRQQSLLNDQPKNKVCEENGAPLIVFCVLYGILGIAIICMIVYHCIQKKKEAGE